MVYRLVDGGDCCRDDDAWYTVRAGETVSCAWVAEHPPRCRARGSIPGKVLGQVEASYACPAACGTPCHDDRAWHKTGDPLKTCAWVAAHAPRCSVRGEDGIVASEACPDACAE